MSSYSVKKKFNRIVNDLRPYKPGKVILFGSYAWGKPTKDSDIDLLIIKNTKKLRHQRTDEALNFIYRKEYFGDEKKFPGPVDVIVFTPGEIKKRMRQGDYFITKIVKRGKQLL